MKRLRIAVVMGTRPEAIKLAPVIHALRERSQEFETVVIATAQHRQMLDQVLNLYGIVPDVDLDLMRPNQDLGQLTSQVLCKVQPVLREINPKLLMVQGDTTTVFATALAAFYLGQPVAHVEAGLRSHDIKNPFPEEINRRLASVLTDIHFAPTLLGYKELVGEGVSESKIVITGNTVVDALAGHLTSAHSTDMGSLPDLSLQNHRLLLVTSHRRESLGKGLRNICLALRDLVNRVPDLVIVFPVHLNPNVCRTVMNLLDGVERIHLTQPLEYETFLLMMRRAHLILTDSGGVQEEAPAMRKPVLVLREVTERPEASLAGMSKIVGTSREVIVDEALRLLSDRAAYDAMTSGKNPYGDGRAAERIVAAISRWAIGKNPLLPPERWFQIPEGEPALQQAGRLRVASRSGKSLVGNQIATD